MRTNVLSGRGFLIVVLLLGGATLAAYFNSLAVPFVFDDSPAIVENPSIRHLWPISDVLRPEIDGGATVSGRPVVNLSFALNYAMGGLDVGGYHLVNLLIHISAGLLLFGVVRRTLLLPPLAKRYGPAALPLAFAVALIWLLHPLQTESVTYVVQRAESLVGLWYLLTVYLFICGSSRESGRTWLIGSVLAGLLGMATKEVMVTAPLVVLLYDRTFVTGTFRAAWTKRKIYYSGLAATWLLLAILVAGTGGRGGTAGFGAGIGVWEYTLTQCRAIVHYLRLVVWPDPLVFDYGTGTVTDLSAVWLHSVFLLGLAIGTVWALVRRPAWGFLGAVFLMILAPSSSVVPVVSQTMAEHRMYLPLIVPIMLFVFGLHRLAGRGSFPVFALVALAAGWLTIQRNADYQSVEQLWADTVAKYPANGRAHHELGMARFRQGALADAMACFRESIRLEPLSPDPHYNLGIVLARSERWDEAMAEYREALRLRPDLADARNNLGILLLAAGRTTEAETQFREIIRHQPGYISAYINLSHLLLELGRPEDAIPPAQDAVRLDPAYVEARYNLGTALAETGQLTAAAAEYEVALQLQPDHAEVLNNLGNVMLGLDRVPEAIARYQEAIRLKPDYLDPRRNLAFVLVHLGRNAEAVRQLETLLQLRPDDAEVRQELARLRAAGAR